MKPELMLSNNQTQGIANISGQLVASDAENAQSELNWSLQTTQNDYGEFTLDTNSGL